MEETYIQEHIVSVNDAYRERDKATKLGQTAYNRATWQYAKEASWFHEHGITIWHDQQTGQIRLATEQEKEILKS